MAKKAEKPIEKKGTVVPDLIDMDDDDEGKDAPNLSDGDEIEEALKEASESDDDDDSEESLEQELASSAAGKSGDDDDEEPEETKEEKKKTPVVLVPVSIRLDKAKIIAWFKKFDSLDSYVIFTNAGDNQVELFGVDAPSRISVLTKLSNLDSESIKKEVTKTGYIPMSNDKESLLRHLNVVGGDIVDLIYDGKDLTIRTSEDESTFSPNANQVDKAVAMKKLFKMDTDKDGGIKALDVVYKNEMVFDNEKFSDLFSRWKNYKREYMAYVIDDTKVMCRFIEDMADLDKKSGAKVAITPKAITSTGKYQITFTKLSLEPMAAIVGDDDIVIHYFSNDHPYIVTTKNGETIMIVASTIVPTKMPEEEDEE